MFAGGPKIIVRLRHWREKQKYYVYEALLGRIARTLCVDAVLSTRMSHVAWSACLVSCAKTVESIEMLPGDKLTQGAKECNR